VTATLEAVCFAAAEPQRLAEFWAALLRWKPAPTAAVPSDDTGFRLRFLPTEEPKSGLNRAHIELTSATLDAQEATVTRALELGAQHLDVGQLPEEGHVVLADPAGNEFCVIEPGNSFLAECGYLGALSCDGTQSVGYFWSEALGWPLVWDQDEETAIRSPHGGPKITWGGPPLNPRVGTDRVRFDVAPADDSDQATEVDRLLALGASLLDTTGRNVLLADPDGSPFCVLPRRRADG
jgi:hypothetical protein